MIAPTRVDLERPDELACGGVDHVHVEVLDEQQDGGSRVGSPQPDRVQLAVEPEAHLAGLVDLVATRAGVVVVLSAARRGLGSS